MSLLGRNWFIKIIKIILKKIPVPFHLLSLKQVSNNDLSTYAKTAIRINCKLGGVPWSVADINDEVLLIVFIHKYFICKLCTVKHD